RYDRTRTISLGSQGRPRRARPAVCIRGAVPRFSHRRSAMSPSLLIPPDWGNLTHTTCQRRTYRGDTVIGLLVGRCRVRIVPFVRVSGVPIILALGVLALPGSASGQATPVSGGGWQVDEQITLTPQVLGPV